VNQYEIVIALPTQEKIEKIRNGITAYHQSLGKDFNFSLDAGFEWLDSLF
jgi:hypothetical protein